MMLEMLLMHDVKWITEEGARWRASNLKPRCSRVDLTPSAKHQRPDYSIKINSGETRSIRIQAAAAASLHSIAFSPIFCESHGRALASSVGVSHKGAL